MFCLIMSAPPIFPSFPSLYDNSPFTGQSRQLAAGKPVIGISSGGTPEYVIHNQVGLIVPARDSAALAEAIKDLVRQ